MENKWYWAFKYVLFGPALRVWNRPWSEGMGNIPATGPALVVSNHQAVMDSFYFPLLCDREITFPAKSEYFTTPGLVGRVQKWFFTVVKQEPLVRDADNAADALLATARRILGRGDVFAIYPEGTRSPDGRVYRGRTGMAKIAMDTGVPVVPLAMIDSRRANPIGTWVPRPVRVGVRVGPAVDPLAWAAERGLDPHNHATIRAFTDVIMHELAELAGQDYVDVYASDVKKSLAAGEGYPPEATPAGTVK